MLKVYRVQMINDVNVTIFVWSSLPMFFIFFFFPLLSIIYHVSSTIHQSAEAKATLVFLYSEISPSSTIYRPRSPLRFLNSSSRFSRKEKKGNKKRVLQRANSRACGNTCVGETFLSSFVRTTWKQERKRERERERGSDADIREHPRVLFNCLAPRVSGSSSLPKLAANLCNITLHAAA